MPTRDGVELFWIPLGAESRVPVVRWSGRLYERLQAGRDRRRPQPLFHAALRVWVDDTWTAIEMAPAWGRGAHDGPVAFVGPVGHPTLGLSPVFRYQVRCRERGVIPDLKSAIGGPTWLTERRHAAQRVLDAVPSTPAATWGRDELHTGEMWNSNSLVAWLLTRSDIDIDRVRPPDGGRAPGWGAGVAVAQRYDSTGGHEQTR
jgi:hypothetical protein